MARSPGSPCAVALVLVAVVAATTLAPGAPAAGNPGGTGPPSTGVVTYRPPVDGPIVDGFRPPARPWLPGNRGVDHATTPGAPVRVAAPGIVLFAGPVAGALHVTVGHADGLRTSYSFLASVGVLAGQRLGADAVLGTAGAVLHWGVRDASGTYLDPSSLLGRPVSAVLVPGGDDGAVRPGPGGLAGLVDAVAGGLSRHGPDVLGWPLDLARAGVDRLALPPGLQAWAHQLGELHPAPHVARVLVGLRERLTAPCTGSEVPTPGPGGRRVAVLVGGFGSTSDHAGIDGLDTTALGYDRADVLRFSYRGGRTPPDDGDGTGGDRTAGGLQALPTSTYDALDTQDDLHVAADELALLLRRVATAHPGVPVDVLAHSQGGLVTRLALDAAAERGELPPEVDLVATFGTPHRGADLATVATNLDGDPEGALALRLAGALGLPADPDRPALAQLAETSDEVRSVAGRPPPAGVRLLSIAARGDLTVPAPRTHVVGGTEATVPLVGPSAHDALAGDPRAAREVALARAGLPPGCRSVSEVVADLVVGEGVGWAEDAVGAALGGGVRAIGPPLPG